MLLRKLLLGRIVVLQILRNDNTKCSTTKFTQQEKLSYYNIYALQKLSYYNIYALQTCRTTNVTQKEHKRTTIVTQNEA